MRTLLFNTIRCKKLFVSSQNSITQGVSNQGDHGKVRELNNSAKIMENLVNFVKLSLNQGTLHFCLLNIAKKSPNKRYQKRKHEEKEMKQNLKRKKD